MIVIDNLSNKQHQTSHTHDLQVAAHYIALYRPHSFDRYLHGSVVLVCYRTSTISYNIFFKAVFNFFLVLVYSYSENLVFSSRLFLFET